MNDNGYFSNKLGRPDASAMIANRPSLRYLVLCILLLLLLGSFVRHSRAFDYKTFCQHPDRKLSFLFPILYVELCCLQIIGPSRAVEKSACISYPPPPTVLSHFNTLLCCNRCLTEDQNANVDAFGKKFAQERVITDIEPILLIPGMQRNSY